MAYTSSKLALLEYCNALGRGVWVYDAGADSAAAVAGSGYISDAAEGTSVVAGASKNMQLGDVVIVIQTSSSACTGISVYGVSAIASSGAATIIKTATA